VIKETAKGSFQNMMGFSSESSSLGAFTFCTNSEQKKVIWKLSQ
jgi:hypothetical protein